MHLPQLSDLIQILLTGWVLAGLRDFEIEHAVEVLCVHVECGLSTLSKEVSDLRDLLAHPVFLSGRLDQVLLWLSATTFTALDRLVELKRLLSHKLIFFSHDLLLSHGEEVSLHGFLVVQFESQALVLSLLVGLVLSDDVIVVLDDQVSEVLVEDGLFHEL